MFSVLVGGNVGAQNMALNEQLGPLQLGSVGKVASHRRLTEAASPCLAKAALCLSKSGFYFSDLFL